MRKDLKLKSIELPKDIKGLLLQLAQRYGVGWHSRSIRYSCFIADVVALGFHPLSSVDVTFVRRSVRCPLSRFVHIGQGEWMLSWLCTGLHPLSSVDVTFFRWSVRCSLLWLCWNRQRILPRAYDQRNNLKTLTAGLSIHRARLSNGGKNLSTNWKTLSCCLSGMLGYVSRERSVSRNESSTRMDIRVRSCCWLLNARETILNTRNFKHWNVQDKLRSLMQNMKQRNSRMRFSSLSNWIQRVCVGDNCK